MCFILFSKCLFHNNLLYDNSVLCLVMNRPSIKLDLLKTESTLKAKNLVLEAVLTDD